MKTGWGRIGVCFFWVGVFLSLPARSAEVRATTASSIIHISNTAKPTTQWIWFHIEKDGEASGAEDVFTAVVNQAYEQKIYLRQGPGIYLIKIRETANAEKFSSYFELDNARVTNTDEQDHAFLFPTAQVESTDPEIVSLARELTHGLTSDSEKIRQVHDWVAQNLAYDSARFRAGIAVNDSALSVLHSRVGVCNGYARLNAALLRAIGIRARNIIGTTTQFRGQLHEWNEVYLDGVWQSIDPTWDSGYLNSRLNFEAHFTRHYLLPKPAQFLKDHFADHVALDE